MVRLGLRVRRVRVRYGVDDSIGITATGSYQRNKFRAEFAPWRPAWLKPKPYSYKKCIKILWGKLSPSDACSLIVGVMERTETA